MFRALCRLLLLNHIFLLNGLNRVIFERLEPVDFDIIASDFDSVIKEEEDMISFVEKNKGIDYDC